MEQDMRNKIYSNNNNLLLGIITDLQQIINDTQDNLVIKRIGDIINKMNIIISEIRKNTELIINHMNKRFDQLNINNNQLNKKVINYKNGERYVGQVMNGLREGKGTYYCNTGERYEGEWRNDKREGKGINYWNSGDRYEGDYKNGRREGKGIYYFNNGNRYEGDWKNDKMEGKGIKYWNDGDRDMGDYSNDQPIGKHARLTKSREVKTVNY